MAEPEATDGFAALLDRARGGDNAALTDLARQYEPELRIVARVLLGPSLRPFLDSVDLVQSVHRSLMVGLRQGKFDISNPEKLVALALTMVRRKVARKWRRLRRQQRLGPSSADASEYVSVLASLASPHPDPVRAAQMNETLQSLWRQLDEQDRRVVELRLEGHSTAEAARALNLDADVLRVRLSRLRQRLRTEGVFTEWL